MKKIVIIFLSLILMMTTVSCKKNNIKGNEDNLVDTSAAGYYDKFAQVDKTKPAKTLIENNATEYSIIIPKNATVNEKYSAQELQIFAQKVTKVTFTINTDEAKIYNSQDKVISIGKTIYQKQCGLDVDYSKLKSGGFICKTVGNLIIIDSNSIEGTLYGVYNFLELFFEVEFLTADYTYIPSKSKIEFYPMNITEIPTFAVRDFYSHPVFNNAVFSSRMRMNSSTLHDDERFNERTYYRFAYQFNGQERMVDREGHTIQYMLAAQAYLDGVTNDPMEFNGDFKTGYSEVHPTWYCYNPDSNYANKDGYVQDEICYTNGITDDDEYDSSATDTVTSKMIEICKNMIKNEVSKNAIYLMLGHSDDFITCQCERCKKSYERNANFAGATIVWTNAIAKEIKKWMKEEKIDREVNFIIFAYNKSLDAPVVKNSDGSYVAKNEKVKTRDDVSVKFAYMSCTYHSVFDESCSQNEPFRERFKGWEAASKSINIWDYMTNFRDYLWYMPNLGIVKDNYKHYEKIGTKHVLSQGMPTEYNNYEHSLKMYVCCKMMWNPNRDVDELIKTFNRLYFGEKYSKYVDEYYNLMQRNAAKQEATDPNSFHASIYDDFNFKNAKYYSLELFEKGISLIEQAIAESKNDSELTNSEKYELETRLLSVKITPQYMLLNLGFLVDAASIKTLAKDFFNNVDRLGLTYFKEGQLYENSFDSMKGKYDLT